MNKVDLGKFKELEGEGLLRSQEDGNLIIWCYTNKCQYDRVWTPETRMSRGLVTTKQGEIVCRPFPKFFNLNEMEETRLSNLPKEPYEVFEKLDGSLLNLFYYKGWQATTKGSFDIVYIDEAKKFFGFDHLNVMWNTNRHHTICTEAVVPADIDLMRRVVDHDPGLYFLAAMDNETGQEIMDSTLTRVYRSQFSRDNKEFFAKPVDRSLEDLIARGSGEEGTEGWVIRYASGLRVRIKTFWYLKLFKFLSHCNDEGIKEFLIGNEDDGWKQAIPEEFRLEVDEICRDIMFRYDSEVARLDKKFKDCYSENRKEFALAVKDDPNSWALFNMLDGNPIREKLLRKI